jgi:hypothetical protein
MSFKNSETVVGTPIATSGTKTFAYPAGTSAGTFAAYGHKLWVDKFQRLLSSPSDFTVAFGASEITVTYLGATTIPTGARLNAQFNVEGSDSNEAAQAAINEADIKRTVLGSVVRVTLGSPAVADTNGYVESQNLTSAGVFSVDTTAAAALAAAALNGVPDVPRNVVASWTGTAVLTVTGKDEYGNTIVESSGSGTSFTGAKAFAEVTDISVSANVTSLTVGTGNKLGLPAFLSNEANVINVKEGSVVYDKGSKVFLNSDTPSLADAGQVYGVSPIGGHIKDVYAVTNTAVATADSTLTVKTAAGTVGTITIALSGSAVGVVDSLSGPANTTVLAGGTVEVENDAAPSAGAASITTVIEPGGLLVAGVSDAATATTGDVRGTYEPLATLDGATEITLLVAEPDPAYKGVTQYAG